MPDVMETFQVIVFPASGGVDTPSVTSSYYARQKKTRVYTDRGQARSYRTRLGRYSKSEEVAGSWARGSRRPPIDITTIRILHTRIHADGTVTTDWID